MHQQALMRRWPHNDEVRVDNFSAEKNTHGMNVAGRRRDNGFAGGEGDRLSHAYDC